MPKQKNKKNITPNRGEIIIYTDPRGKAKLEVKLQNETMWLTQAQIAELFGIDRSVITKHFKNIFASGELEEKSNVHFLHIPNSDKPVKFYNLDAVISIGYRTNSKRATEFRIWATRVLRDHILKGYTINEQRLVAQAKQFKELQATINFLKDKIKYPELHGQAEELLNIISDYAQTLTVLHEYDQGTLELSRRKKARFVLSYGEFRQLIDQTKAILMKKKEASTLFGQEYGEKFQGMLASIYQTFGGQELYKTVEEKAAHLLYLTIKDHPFADGNKRVGSLLFVYFLNKNQYLFKKSGERKIGDTTLVALALLIAMSAPKEKDVMIKLVTNLL